MAELVPAPFADLVTRLYREPRTQDALFELPRRKWWLPDDSTPDLSVAFHGRRAGNPAGPAAGPHTQMAQNLLLSYAAGGRILELKTVQVNDRLTIGRPCIDLTNVGYNIEWSQELLVEQSLREYVAGMMLIEMFRASREHTAAKLDGPAGDVLYDISVGYDLAGIRSDKIRGFLDAMRAAGPWIDLLRAEIPAAFAAARELNFPTRLSDSITLSTFHGCPADEIEAICEFLIGELDFDVIVKMNPPTLGREKLEHLLHDTLGYRALRVNPKAYDAAISFDESIELCERLTAFAARRGRSVGFKFSNTLEVENHRNFFTPDNRIMYLSGQPLHVIALALTDEFCRAVAGRRAGDVPISFSAGIDARNFPLAVACGFTPVTTCSDLLRPGGYGRFPAYLDALAREMRRLGARTIDEYVVRFAQRFAAHSERRAEPQSEPEAPARVAPRGLGSAPRAGASTPAARESLAGVSGWESRRSLFAAQLANTTTVAAQAREDPRYRADRNAQVPRRLDSHLAVFDCVTCDKCLPVCPNAANFTYPTPIVAFAYRDILVAPDGAWRQASETRRFEITKSMQIACYADFCNECGNCDTFCPEYGGPYIEKPSFHGSRTSWLAAAPRDGFYVERRAAGDAITGRVKGTVFELRVDAPRGVMQFDDGVVRAELDAKEHAVRRVGQTQRPGSTAPSREPGAPAEHRLDLWAFHTLRTLLAGVLDSKRTHEVNAGCVE